jgi:hypothetical protein
VGAAACAALPASPAAGPESSSPRELSTSTPTPTDLAIYVTQLEYGLLSISTMPGATCTVSGVLFDGTAVDGLSGKRKTDREGKITWTYPKKPTNARGGQYTISCAAGHLQDEVTVTFAVASQP